MIHILHINLIAGRSGAAGLCQSIIDGLDSGQFSSHQLVWYDFVGQKNTTSKYITTTSKRYKTIRYKGAVWLNFLFELMTPECIDYKRLSQQVFYQQADIIHLHSIQWGYFNRHDLDKISTEKKIIMTLHDDWIVSWNDQNNNLFPYKKNFQYNKRLEVLQPLPITYVWVSDWMSNKIKNDPIVWSNAIYTIYNGINTSIFKETDKIQARNQLWLPLDKTISISIAWSGSKSNLKGLQYVKKLAKQYKSDSSVLFMTIWNHTYNSYENIIELPFISQQDIALYFSAADIFLYPTLADSFGLVVAESLACWCPVITFNTWWVPEIITNKKGNYIAKYKDYDDLLQWFQWAIKQKNTISVSLDHKFSLHHMIQQYQELYLKLHNT